MTGRGSPDQDNRCGGAREQERGVSSSTSAAPRRSTSRTALILVGALAAMLHGAAGGCRSLVGTGIKAWGGEAQLAQPLMLTLSLRGGGFRVPGRGRQRTSKKKRRPRLKPYDSSEREGESTDSSRDADGWRGDSLAVSAESAAGDDESSEGDGGAAMGDKGERGHPKMFDEPGRPREDQFDWQAYGGDEDDELVSVDDGDGGKKLERKPRPGRGEKRAAKLEAKRKARQATVTIEGGEEDDDQDNLQRGQKKKKKKKGKSEFDEDDFGKSPRDFIDGGAFEDRLGTYMPEDNLFTLPTEVAARLSKGSDVVQEVMQHEAVLDAARKNEMDKRAAKKAEKAQREAAPVERGVMYIGYIPKHFQEEQQYQYFSQFGKVNRLRLARDRKTGKYKGYGFVEWEDKRIGEKAARQMNGYMMYHKLLRCHMVPNDKVHPETFRNANKPFVRIDRCKMDAKIQARPKTPKQEAKCRRRRLLRQRIAEGRVMRRYGHLGWKFDETNSENARIAKARGEDYDPAVVVKKANFGSKAKTGLNPPSHRLRPVSQPRLTG